MRFHKRVCKAEPIRVYAAIIARTITELTQSYIVVSRHAMRRHGLYCGKTVLPFVKNFGLHGAGALPIESDGICGMGHKASFARAGRGENNRYHLLSFRSLILLTSAAMALKGRQISHHTPLQSHTNAVPIAFNTTDSI